MPRLNIALKTDTVPNAQNNVNYFSGPQINLWSTGVTNFLAINQQGLQVSDNSKLLLNPNGGNVGIGTASPTKTLEVAGSVRINRNPSDYLMQFVNGTTSVGIIDQNGTGLALENGDGSAAVGVGLGSVSQVTLNTLGVQRLTVTTNGNIGIGKNNPTSALDVSGTVTATSFSGSGAALTSVSAASLTGTIPLAQLPASVITNGTSGVNFSGTFTGNGAGLTNLNYVSKSGDTMSGTLNLPANGLTAGGNQLVLANGKVGIGKSNPVGTLDVLTTNGAYLTFELNPGELSLFGPTGSSLTLRGPAGYGTRLLFAGSGGRYWLAGASGNDNFPVSSGMFYIYDSTTPAARLVIDSVGNVGIGTTTPASKLDVNGAATVRGVINAVGGLIIENRTSDPAAPATGQIWLRTDLP